MNANRYLRRAGQIQIEWVCCYHIDRIHFRSFQCGVSKESRDKNVCKIQAIVQCDQLKHKMNLGLFCFSVLFFLSAIHQTWIWEDCATRKCQMALFYATMDHLHALKCELCPVLRINKLTLNRRECTQIKEISVGIDGIIQFRYLKKKQRSRRRRKWWYMKQTY